MYLLQTFRGDAMLTLLVKSHMSAICLHTLTVTIDFAHFQHKLLLSESHSHLICMPLTPGTYSKRNSIVVTVFLASPSQITSSMILCATKFILLRP